MEMISDALLIAGALGAALYCRVLAKKLIALKNLDTGLGASIAALSRQVDEMKLSLEAAKSASGGQGREMRDLTQRAETAAGRLEMLLASIHREQRETARAAAQPAPRPAARREANFDDDEDDARAETRAARRYAPHGGRRDETQFQQHDPDEETAPEDFAVEFERDLEREREDAFRQRVLQAMRRGETA